MFHQRSICQSVNLILFHSFSTNFRTFENSVVVRIATDLGFGQLRQAQEKAPPTSTQSEFFKARNKWAFLMFSQCFVMICISYCVILWVHWNVIPSQNPMHAPSCTYYLPIFLILCLEVLVWLIMFLLNHCKSLHRLFVCLVGVL